MTPEEFYELGKSAITNKPLPDIIIIPAEVFPAISNIINSQDDKFITVHHLISNK